MRSVFLSIFFFFSELHRLECGEERWRVDQVCARGGELCRMGDWRTSLRGGAVKELRQASGGPQDERVGDSARQLTCSFPLTIKTWPIMALFPFLMQMLLLFTIPNPQSTSHKEISKGYPQSFVAPRQGQDFWERNKESGCFHIDSVCNWEGGWFYGPDQRWGLQSNTSKYQPTATLLGTLSEDMDILDWNDLNVFVVDDRIQVNISSKSHDMYDEATCSFSPTPNHLVAHSAYSKMMGEFYVRTIMGLNRWMRDYPQASEDDVQVYLHFTERHDILEGHRLFLEVLPSNNKFDNFLSLMPRNDSCRCFRKLIFCGYYVENVTTFRSNHSKIFSDDLSNTLTLKERMRSKIDPGDRNAIVFRPQERIPNPVTDCEGCRENAYRELRSDLLKSHSKRYQHLEEKIRHYRTHMLVESGLVGNNTIDADGWKLIGLARRKLRRLWLNIDEVMLMCKNFIKHQAACIIVDVEEAKSPEKQLIMHRSLFAFIGIHGAQLTQGVLLPPHGYILELLPWIPTYSPWGCWAADTGNSTPLGEIFHNTDINHYGYSLGRESTPLCSHVDMLDEDGTRLCLTNETNEEKFRWDIRDFIVPVQAIESFIAIILQHGENATCEEMRTGAVEGNLVLYNAFCRKSADQANFVTKHYYHNRSSCED